MVEEEDLILAAQEQARQRQPILQALTSIDSKLAKMYSRTNKSMRVTVDLSVVHTDEPVGIKGSGIVYLWLTIEQADSNFTYKLKQTNEKKSDSFIGSQGASVDQHEFTEIYVTNAAATGQAIILVGWRE